MKNNLDIRSVRVSIRQKLILSFLLLVVVIITVFSISSYLEEREIIRRGIERRGTDVIRTFTQMAVPYVFEMDYVTVLDNARELVADGEILSIAVIDLEGEPLIHTEEMSREKYEIDAFYREVIENRQLMRREMMEGKQPILEFVSPLSSLERVVYLIRMVISLEPVKKSLTQTAHRLIFLSSGLVFLAVLLALFLSEIFVEPIRKLLEGTREMARGNLSHRIKIRAFDEIGDLADSFNEMGTKLEDNFDQIRRQHHEIQDRMEQVKKAEEKYRGIFENAEEGIFQADNHGQFISANPSMARLAGFSSPEALLSKESYRLEDFFMDLEQWVDFEKKLRRTGKVIGFEARIYRKSDDMVWGSVTARHVLDSKGEPRFCEGSVLDISAGKRAEALRREKAIAETASREKSEFLANMSHEIRTPLTAILGFMALSLKTNLEPRQREYLEKAMSSARLLLSIINDILDFSKIEAGKLVLESAPFELESALYILHDLFAGSASDKGVEFILEVDDDVPHSLIGDSLRLGQILTNLTGNAIKFTERGEIFVQVKLSPALDERTWLQFSVRDTGMGIEKETLDRLFSPFTQADESTTRKFGGTGLGLTIAKRLTEILGGKIWAQSSPSKGSVFYFQIPFQLQKVEKSLAFHVPKSIEASRVLVIDDNKSSRNYLIRTLRGFGMEAMSVGSGLVAVQNLKKENSRERFDLLLIDQRMPEISGVKVARAIRDECGLTDIPIIMMSKFGRVAFLRKSDRDVRIDGFIFKPVRKDQLFAAIMDVFKQEKGKAAESATTETESRNHLDKLKGIRVLVVEDNIINQQVAMEILQDAGVQAQMAGNGKEAIELILNQDGERNPDSYRSFDAIFMDIQMPVLDGLETARILRDRGVRIPIIAITAHALKGNQDKCRQAGMDDFIAKPFEPEMIYETLARWIKD